MADVKGSLLEDVVRLIRANKDKDWRKYLTEKDLDIIHGQILPSSWYPLDVYERAEFAVFMEIGKGKLEMAHQWGRFLMEDLVKRVYQNLIEEGDPMIALERFSLFRKQLFRFNDPNFRVIEFQQTGEKKARITIRIHHPVETFEAYTHQSIGSFERLVELAGGKNVAVNIVEYEWKGKIPYSVLDISWQ